MERVSHVPFHFHFGWSLNLEEEGFLKCVQIALDVIEAPQGSFVRDSVWVESYYRIRSTGIYGIESDNEVHVNDEDNHCMKHRLDNDLTRVACDVSEEYDQ